MRTKAVLMLIFVMFIIIFCCKKRDNGTHMREVTNTIDTTIVSDTTAVSVYIP
jgi:hypothetical protein